MVIVKSNSATIRRSSSLAHSTCMLKFFVLTDPNEQISLMMAAWKLDGFPPKGLNHKKWYWSNYYSLKLTYRQERCFSKLRSSSCRLPLQASSRGRWADHFSPRRSLTSEVRSPQASWLSALLSTRVCINKLPAELAI